MVITVHLLALFALLGSGSAAEQKPGGYPFDVTTISAPDGSVSAKFLSLGSTLTELWVKDKHGKRQDVVLGYDDNSKLLTDPAHPYFNGIVGRYANRIKNGTFSIPVTKDPQPAGPGVYSTPLNDRNDTVTLHGGIAGWDRRNWTAVHKSHTSVTFKLADNAQEGFPGTVTAYATHSVSNGGILNTKIFAKATEKTPVMLAQHIYWNLNAFQDNSSTALNHKLKIPGSKVVETDGNLIPTGELIDVSKETIFDFRKGRVIGERFSETISLCQAPCQGYDHCWIYDKPEGILKSTTLSSNVTGIQVEISSHQPAVQIYNGYGLNITRKQFMGDLTNSTSVSPPLSLNKRDGLMRLILQSGKLTRFITQEGIIVGTRRTSSRLPIERPINFSFKTLYKT